MCNGPWLTERKRGESRELGDSRRNYAKRCCTPGSLVTAEAHRLLCGCLLLYSLQGAIPPKSSARRVVVRHEAPRRLMAPDRRPAGLPRPQRA